MVAPSRARSRYCPKPPGQKQLLRRLFHERASQSKALKGFLIAQGRRSVPIHSVARLIEECSRIDKDFSSHIAPGRILDQYYIPTRYPDALAPPAVPFESYTQEQGEKAVHAAKTIVSLVRQKLRVAKKR
ncbi:MAG TPA: HEPN domain-containing protein [Candidatus Binatia bacterium]|nr:HEPN domain-containing protein [Candidatus Binatia bacterium]